MVVLKNNSLKKFLIILGHWAEWFIAQTETIKKFKNWNVNNENIQI